MRWSVGRGPRGGAFLVAAAACLWGLWPIWVRGGPSGAKVATLALAACGVLGLPLALVESRGRSRPVGAWLWLLVLGLAEAANCGCYFRALAEGAVAPAVLAHYLAPVLVALSAPFFLREPSARRTPIALCLAIAGTAFLVFSSGSMGGGAAVRAALLLGGASAIFYATCVLVSKKLAPHFGDAEIMVYHALVAAVCLAPLTGVTGTPRQLGSSFLGGAISSLLAGVLYYGGLRRIPAERAAILGYLEPLVAVIVGWAVFAEMPSAAAGVGGVLILAGGALVVFD